VLSVLAILSYLTFSTLCSISFLKFGIITMTTCSYICIFLKQVVTLTVVNGRIATLVLDKILALMHFESIDSGHPWEYVHLKKCPLPVGDADRLDDRLVRV